MQFMSRRRTEQIKAIGLRYSHFRIATVSEFDSKFSVSCKDDERRLPFAIMSIKLMNLLIEILKMNERGGAFKFYQQEH